MIGSPRVARVLLVAQDRGTCPSKFLLKISEFSELFISRGGDLLMYHIGVPVSSMLTHPPRFPGNLATRDTQGIR